VITQYVDLAFPYFPFKEITKLNPQFKYLTEFLAWLSVNPKQGANYNSLAAETEKIIKAKIKAGKEISPTDYAKLDKYLEVYLPKKKMNVIHEALKIYKKGPIETELAIEQGEDKKVISARFRGYLIHW